jgi:MoaA/NifB/PqqE/SkfB family radical SAM enzyme
MGEYRNENIVAEVFDRVDGIVVPSIWEENSPLVIHEAQHARVPIVTADVGGMAEYVQHEVNGLLFRHRDSCSMSEQMQRLLDAPGLARELGARGYPRSATGDVPSIEAHVRSIEAIYSTLIADKRASRVERPGPWRITFDTNPDDCNLRCVMCEEHSPHSTLQVKRRVASIPNRRMDIALIRRVLEGARGTPLREIIPSTMGEPLLYAHFDEILDLCREFDVRLNLTTNGTFPRRGARAWAERIVPVSSDVKLSWNGATRQTNESIMLGTRWENVVENVQAFLAVRGDHAAAGGNYCRVTFQATFMESNIAELPELVKLAAALGVDRVKVHHLWVHFDQLEGESLRRSPEAIARWNRIVGQTERAAAENPLPNGKPVLLENIHRLDPTGPRDSLGGGACPFLGQEAWVSAEGRFNPCCAPDALRRTLGNFGNLQEQTLSQIWTGSPYGSLRENYMENRLCQTCNMRKPASGK